MHITIDYHMWGNKYGGIGKYTKEIVPLTMAYTAKYKFILRNNNLAKYV